MNKAVWLGYIHSRPHHMTTQDSRNVPMGEFLTILLLESLVTDNVPHKVKHAPVIIETRPKVFFAAANWIEFTKSAEGSMGGKWKWSNRAIVDEEAEFYVDMGPGGFR